MRIASIITAEPAALSVAPVPECHESKCAPSITTSAALSVPGSSATMLKASSESPTKRFCTFSSSCTGTLPATSRVMRLYCSDETTSCGVIIGGFVLQYDGRRVVDEDRAAIVAPGARLERGHHTLARKELIEPLVEAGGRRRAAGARAAAPPGVHRLHLQVDEFLIGESPRQRRGEQPDVHGGLIEHDLARELAGPGGEVGVGPDGGDDGIGGDRTVGARASTRAARQSAGTAVA